MEYGSEEYLEWRSILDGAIRLLEDPSFEPCPAGLPQDSDEQERYYAKYGSEVEAKVRVGDRNLFWSYWPGALPPIRVRLT